MPLKKNLALGLMSGTSADGLTICLFDAGAKKALHFKTYPYSKQLQNKILDAVNMQTPALSALNFELGRIYAEKAQKFLQEFKINKNDIAVIGSHGQTVWHAPGGASLTPEAKIPNTLQIGEAAFLAQALKIPVVHNFRPRDMAAGGSGAPLMPAFDDFLYGDCAPRMLLNIGGISNIALAGRGIKTFGFDIGPGNALIDCAVNILSRGRLNYDKGGAHGAKHAPDIKKAQSLLKFFVKNRPPKSLERSAFGKDFINKNFPALKEADIATVTYLTALIIAGSIKKFILNKYNPKILEISGGGVYNKTLLKFLAEELNGIKITRGCEPTPMAKEAAAFAWFALQTIDGKPSNCPAATGAKEKIILGSVILP